MTEYQAKDSREDIVLRNECATVDVSIEQAANRDRLQINDVTIGKIAHLEAFEMSCIMRAWGDTISDIFDFLTRPR